MVILRQEKAGGGGETTLRLQNLVIKQHGNKKRDKKRKLE